MKRIFSILLLFTTILAFSSCSGDGEGGCSGIWSEGECIPDFVFPPYNGVKSGDKLFHKKYGIIEFKNDNWTNINGSIITRDELLIE